MIKKRVRTDKVELYIIDDFLSKDECKVIRDYIKYNNFESTIYKQKEKKNAKSNVRTSKSSALHVKKMPFIRGIDKRMSRTIGVPLELGEPTQGQLYEVGDEFKDHCDFFDMKSVKDRTSSWGNRTWTFMIYLNGECKGGETEFPLLGAKFLPKEGRAVIWRNMNPDGTMNKLTRHAGRPVTHGEKFIITKWFREYPTGSYKLSNYFRKNYPDKADVWDSANKVKSDSNLKKTQVKSFSGYQDFPRFTEKGFKRLKVPSHIWDIISNTYQENKSKVRKEVFKNQMGIIHDKDKKNSPVEFIDFPKDKKQEVLKHLHSILEAWSREKLIPNNIYGIRSYLNGAILEKHKDRVETHHISCIIIVDRDGGEPWSLDIQDHNGEWHKVAAEPGEMILYESAACEHGRIDEFSGNYFRNMFCHFRLADWKYTGDSKK